MKKCTVAIDAVDALLPQTQCGLCGYGGCRPYARAIVEGNETIDRCPPGGVPVLERLAQLMQSDPLPYIARVKARQQPIQVARIDEQACIGCTKCLAACPVDAIMGASKQMHTVLDAECSGCGLCIAPCPVDCIDMVDITAFDQLTPSQRDKRALQYRMRYQQRHARQARLKAQLARKHQMAKVAHQPIASAHATLQAKRTAIVQAVERERLKHRQKEEETKHNETTGNSADF